MTLLVCQDENFFFNLLEEKIKTKHIYADRFDFSALDSSFIYFLVFGVYDQKEKNQQKKSRKTHVTKPLLMLGLVKNFAIFSYMLVYSTYIVLPK